MVIFILKPNLAKLQTSRDRKPHLDGIEAFLRLAGLTTGCGQPIFMG